MFLIVRRIFTPLEMYAGFDIKNNIYVYYVSKIFIIL